MALVQHAVTSNPADPASLTLTGVVSGHLLIAVATGAFITDAGGTTDCSVNISGGGAQAMTKVFSGVGLNQQINVDVFYLVANATGNAVFTYNSTQAAGAMGLAVYERDDVDTTTPVRAYGAPASGAAPSTGGASPFTITSPSTDGTPTTDDIAMGAYTWSSGAPTGVTAGTGYTVTDQYTDASINAPVVVEWAPAASGAQAASVTLTGATIGTNYGVIVVWKAAVVVPKQQQHPNSDAAIGSWTDQAGGTTSLYATIDEASTSANDADYVMSPSAPSSASADFGLSTVSTPADNTHHVLRYRRRKHDATGYRQDLTVELRNGASAFSPAITFSESDLGSSFATIQQALTSTQAAQITDYSTLRVRLTANQVTGSAPAPTVVAAGTAAGANGATFSVSYPVSPNQPVTNDIIVLLIKTSANVTPTLPAGWTVKDALDNGTGFRSVVAWKRYGAGDSDTSVTLTSPSGQTEADVLVVRGCVTSGDPFEAYASQANASSTTCTLPSITSLTNNALILAFITSAANTAAAVVGGSTPTFTERFDAGRTSCRVALDTGVLATAGATGSKTATVGSGLNNGALGALKPAPLVNSTVDVSLVEFETASSGAVTVSGAGTAQAATGAGTGAQHLHTLSGAGTADAPTGSGGGINTTGTTSLSGGATAGAPAGSGAGLTFTVPTFTLSGAGTASAPTGSGTGITQPGVPAMPIVNRAVATYVNNGATSTTTDASNDGDYSNTSAGATPWARTYDLVATMPSTVFCVMYHDATGNYREDLAGSSVWYGIAQDYTIDVSNDRSTWTNKVTVSGNFYTRPAHIVDMAGFRYIRWTVTASRGSFVTSNVDIHDASNSGTNYDALLFLGDSWTMEGQLTYNNLAGGQWQLGEQGKQVHDKDGTHWPVWIDGGSGGMDYKWLYSNRVALFGGYPGKYVILCMGTNDINVGGAITSTQITNPGGTLGTAGTAGIRENLRAVISYAQSIGKTVILSRVPSNKANANNDNNALLVNQQVIDPITNSASGDYIAGVVKGPDLWQIFHDHPEILRSDGLHPTYNSTDVYTGVTQSSPAGTWLDAESGLHLFGYEVVIRWYRDALISNLYTTTSTTVTLSGTGTAQSATGSGSGLTSTPPTFTVSGAGTAGAPTGSGTGLQHLATTSGAGTAGPATGSGAGLAHLSTVAGGGTADAPAGGGTGIQHLSTVGGAASADPAGGAGTGVAHLSTLSGSATAGAATGSGPGVNTTGNTTLSGGGVAQSATGSGVGVGHMQVVSGAGTADAPAGTGTGVGHLSTVSGSGTAGSPGGSGAGLATTTPTVTLSGAAVAAAPSGTGAGVHVSAPTVTLTGAGVAQAPGGSGYGVITTGTRSVSGASTAQAAHGAGLGVVTRQGAGIGTTAAVAPTIAGVVAIRVTIAGEATIAPTIDGTPRLT